MSILNSLIKYRNPKEGNTVFELHETTDNNSPFDKAVENIMHLLRQADLHGEFENNDSEFKSAVDKFYEQKNTISSALKNFKALNPAEQRAWFKNKENEQLFGNFIIALNDVNKNRTKETKGWDILWKIADAVVAFFALGGVFGLMKIAGPGIFAGKFVSDAASISGIGASFFAYFSTDKQILQRAYAKTLREAQSSSTEPVTRQAPP